MAVFRIERTRDYTVMSNHHLRNANLSLKAKGLLSMMLSLPEDWNYTTRGLAKASPASTSQARSFTAISGTKPETNGWLTPKPPRWSSASLP